MKAYRPYQIQQFKQIMFQFHQLEANARDNLEAKLSKESIELMKNMGFGETPYNPNKENSTWKDTQYRYALFLARPKYQQAKRILNQIKHSTQKY